ncbi:DNA repair protein RecN [Flavobacteriaceae bacterium]|nr:DNA repair protein RecN [Flavobacteriaceae bacterium]MDA9780911.1 DNA repair protein RecN [Flavobacteriaceae bacterium]
MILSLSIKNYALIEDIQVPLTKGLTIITGETGAGKSILLGALGLLLGKRADLGSVKDATQKCIIEGEFSLKGYGLQPLFKDHDLDYDVHTIIRREILPSGKSRAFVNDTPVGLSQLQALGGYLVDIHSQQETNSFATEVFQLEVLDALAGNAPILQGYQNALSEFTSISKQLEKQLSQKEAALKELDYHTFLQQELMEASLHTIDQQALETNYNTLNNAEEIQGSFAEIEQLFSQENTGIIDSVKQARSLLNNISKYAPSYQELYDRLHSVTLELEDVISSIENTSEDLQVDPTELFRINEVLQTLYRLQHKHSVSSVKELSEIESNLSSKIYNSQHLDTTIETLEKEKQKLTQALLKLAKDLHDNRVEALPMLQQKLETYLSLLGLPNAKFKVEFTTSPTFKKSGTDSLAVYFTANKGGNFGLLKKVASGGEMSRIMLSVKALLSQYKKLPTIVFDEIDTGVSGEIALKMAYIMGEMSTHMQILSITHLPQIAAKGEQHIKVYKEDRQNTTVTHLKQLSQEERIVEIAQMIGGKNITDTTLANAKELLN